MPILVPVLVLVEETQFVIATWKLFEINRCVSAAIAMRLHWTENRGKSRAVSQQSAIAIERAKRTYQLKMISTTIFNNCMISTIIHSILCVHLELTIRLVCFKVQDCRAISQLSVAVWLALNRPLVQKLTYSVWAKVRKKHKNIFQ